MLLGRYGNVSSRPAAKLATSLLGGRDSPGILTSCSKRGVLHLLKNSLNAGRPFFAGRTKALLEVGLLESEYALRAGLPSMLHANRHFRDVLQAKDYTVVYQEINAGHDPLNWQTTLPDLLLAIFANRKEPG